MAHPDRGRMDLAFSGGGVRAALFSAGVALYLLDSGMRDRVIAVSSVSGGSLTNLLLAAGPDFSTGDEAVIRGRLRLFVSELTVNGTFFASPSFVGLTLITIGLVAQPFLTIASDGATFETVLNRILISIVGIVLIGLSSIGLRRQHQQQVYTRLYGRVEQQSASAAARQTKRLGGLPNNSTQHIFCATDLVSGGPAYFTRSWSYIPAFGALDLGSVGMVSILYASAAFPIAFPPLRLRIQPELWNEGGAEFQRPDYLTLADGGVYNNLGTEWRSALETAQRRNFETFDAGAPESSYQVVVNASAPQRILNPPRFLRAARAFFREVSIMYSGTVQLRLQNLRSGAFADSTIVIDIAEDPIRLAESIARRVSDPAVEGRARAMLAELRVGRADQYWRDLNDASANVKTTLSAIGRTSAAAVIHNGYLKASICFGSYLDGPGPETVEPISAFLSMLDG